MAGRRSTVRGPNWTRHAPCTCSGHERPVNLPSLRWSPAGRAATRAAAGRRRQAAPVDRVRGLRRGGTRPVRGRINHARSSLARSKDDLGWYRGSELPTTAAATGRPAQLMTATTIDQSQPLSAALEKFRAMTPEQQASTALYCRVSRDREGAGLAVERQETELREMAARLGLPAVIEPAYSDNDMSAYSLRKPRPGYLALLADIESGRVTHLLAWHNDRLHRSPAELEDFIDVVEAHGVAIQTKHGGLIDLTTPGGRAVARILGAVARLESEIKTERIRSKHVQLAGNGDFNGGGRRW